MHFLSSSLSPSPSLFLSFPHPPSHSLIPPSVLLPVYLFAVYRVITLWQLHHSLVNVRSIHTIKVLLTSSGPPSLTCNGSPIAERQGSKTRECITVQVDRLDRMSAKPGLPSTSLPLPPIFYPLFRSCPLTELQQPRSNTFSVGNPELTLPIQKHTFLWKLVLVAECCQEKCCFCCKATLGSRHNNARPLASCRVFVSYTYLPCIFHVYTYTYIMHFNSLNEFNMQHVEEPHVKMHVRSHTHTY